MAEVEIAGFIISNACGEAVFLEKDEAVDVYNTLYEILTQAGEV